MPVLICFPSADAQTVHQHQDGGRIFLVKLKSLGLAEDMIHLSLISLSIETAYIVRETTAWSVAGWRPS